MHSLQVPLLRDHFGIYVQKFAKEGAGHLLLCGHLHLLVVFLVIEVAFHAILARLLLLLPDHVVWANVS